ncbi:MAG: hypothetical protein V4568_01810 [Pseudomonadota bacterium]
MANDTVIESEAPKNGDKLNYVDSSLLSSSNGAATTTPDIGTADPTDNRKPYEWRSRYDGEARVQIKSDGIYVASVLFLSLVLIFVSWKGIPANLLLVIDNDAIQLKKYCLYSFSGLLGGTVYGIKYLYRVVARGYWHVDRQLWRYLSPWNAMALAFVMGALKEASYVSTPTPTSSATVVSIGFMTGYFADLAIAKLHDIAVVLFGTTVQPKDKSGSK